MVSVKQRCGDLHLTASISAVDGRVRPSEFGRLARGCSRSLRLSSNCLTWNMPLEGINSACSVGATASRATSNSESSKMEIDNGD